MEPAVRERLLEAMLTQFDASGREAMSLADVLGAAKVSEEDFAATWTDLDACLDEAYGRLTDRLQDAITVGCAFGPDRSGRREPGWTERVRAGLAAVLAELADHPARARVLTTGYPSLGPRQQERYQAFVQGLADQLHLRREMAGLDGDLPGEVDWLAVGAAEAIVFEEIAAGRTEALPGMAPSILFSVLVPFLGAARAAAEMEKARGSVG